MEHNKEREFPFKCGCTVVLIIHVNWMLYNHAEQSLEPVTAQKFYVEQIHNHLQFTRLTVVKRNCKLKYKYKYLQI